MRLRFQLKITALVLFALCFGTFLFLGEVGVDQAEF